MTLEAQASNHTNVAVLKILMRHLLLGGKRNEARSRPLCLVACEHELECLITFPDDGADVRERLDGNSGHGPRRPNLLF